MRCLSCTKWIPQICERCRKPEVYDSEIDRLRARIADLEAAGRLLGAEVYGWRNRRIQLKRLPGPTGGGNVYYEVCGDTAAWQEVNSHPTAAGFVKEAGDGH